MPQNIARHYSAVRRRAGVVCGEEDVITPQADAEALHAGIAGSTLELIPKAGHLANLEAPDAFNRALEAFLRRVG